MQGVITVPRRWLVVLLAFVASVALSAQALSPQVLSLLTRTNSWAGQQTFQNLRVFKAAVPSDTTSRLYADVAGNLYWDGGVIAGSSGGSAHNLLSTTHPDTLTGSPVRGDLLVANSTPKWTKIAIGTSGQVLSSNGTDPVWSSNYAKLDASPTFTGVAITATAPTASLFLNHTNVNGLSAVNFRESGADKFILGTGIYTGDTNFVIGDGVAPYLAIQASSDSVRIGKTASTFDVGLAVRASAVSAGLTLRESYGGDSLLWTVRQNNGDGTGAFEQLFDGAGNAMLSLNSNPSVVAQIAFENSGINGHAIRFTNTGGNVYIGQDSSVGASFITGAAAYAAVFGTDSARSVQFATNGIVRQTIDSTGVVTIPGNVTIAGTVTHAPTTIGSGTIVGSMPTAATSLYTINNISGTGTVYGNVFGINSTGSAAFVVGSTGYLYTANSGTTTVAEGLLAVAEHGGTGAVTFLVGIETDFHWSNTGGGTNAMGMYVGPRGRTASAGTFTNGYGLYVDTFGPGITNKYSMYSVDTAAVLYNAGNITSPGVITLGSGAVQLTDATGKIQALSPTYLANLSLANLTGTIASATQDLITRTGTLVSGATGSGFTVALATSTITGILPAANHPALTGDVTNSAGALATTIANGAVTNAKLAGGIDLATKVTGILPAADFPALTGDVTTVAGALATTIGATKVTNAMLAGSIAAAKLIGSDIVTVGTLTAGATGAGFTVALTTSTVTGSLADARLSANVPLLNAANVFTAAQTTANNTFWQSKESGGTVRALIGLDASNVVQIGNGSDTVAFQRFQGVGTNCLYTDNAGVVFGTGAACSSGTGVLSTGSSAGNTAAHANVINYSVGITDVELWVSANVLVNSGATYNFNVVAVCADEAGASRTYPLLFTLLGTAFSSTISNGIGTGPYAAAPIEIRCQGGSTLTISSTGTFTAVNYNIRADVHAAF